MPAKEMAETVEKVTEISADSILYPLAMALKCDEIS